jgi:ribonuclease BN (tRNA processing enzyme)
MEWIVLGSGTAVPHAQRGSAAHLLVGGGVAALLDAGSGCKDRLARFGVPLGSLTHLLFTHAHLDHWADLLPLLFYRAVAHHADRRPGLTVAGPPGFADLVRDVARRIDPGLLDDNDDMRWCELAASQPLDAGWFRASAYRVAHGSQTAQAYRLEGTGGGWSVCYSGDTSPCEGIERAAHGVGCLVCECSFPDGAGRKNHMTPSGVRSLAERAGVATVVLTHLYDEVLASPLPGPAFDGFEGEVLVAHDGMRVAL